MNLMVRRLIELALEEDIGSGDITTDLLISPEKKGKGILFAKESVVVAGIDLVGEVFGCLDPEVRIQPKCCDGDTVCAGNRILEADGRMRSLLTGERTALNFLQRLSGIATWVRSHEELIRGHSIRLVDTRKTTPGWRALEKYAVRIGGGYNHRMGLYDGILIKDNHIQAFGSISGAIEQVRRGASHLMKIEVEVSDINQVKEALSAGAEIIMLDNMDMEMIKRAVALINGKAMVEVSGRVLKKDLHQLADAGIDVVSMGALTHSAPSVDLSMEIQPVDN
ncbi:MAG: carboxylating nicotinate-nucleotide diphosphorylase [Thermodesulfobacteriota bacterium]